VNLDGGAKHGTFSRGSVGDRKSMIWPEAMGAEEVAFSAWRGELDVDASFYEKLGTKAAASD